MKILLNAPKISLSMNLKDIIAKNITRVFNRLTEDGFIIRNARERVLVITNRGENNGL